MSKLLFAFYLFCPSAKIWNPETKQSHKNVNAWNSFERVPKYRRQSPRGRSIFSFRAAGSVCGISENRTEPELCSMGGESKLFCLARSMAPSVHHCSGLPVGSSCSAPPRVQHACTSPEAFPFFRHLTLGIAVLSIIAEERYEDLCFVV